MAVYDSAKTRQAAKKIRRLADSLDMDVKRSMEMAADDQGRLRGRAAEAMEEDCRQLVSAARKLVYEMETLSRRISAYAVLLEDLDDQLAEKL